MLNIRKVLMNLKQQHLSESFINGRNG